MIPLIAALLPLIPAIVQGVEGLFGAGKGPEKKTAAVDSTVAALSALAKKFGIEVPPELLSAVPGLVEWVVQQLKAKGQLESTPAAAPPAPAGPVVSGPGLAAPLTIAGQTFTFDLRLTGTIKAGV